MGSYPHENGQAPAGWECFLVKDGRKQVEETLTTQAIACEISRNGHAGKLYESVVAEVYADNDKIRIKPQLHTAYKQREVEYESERTKHRQSILLSSPLTTPDWIRVLR